MYSNQYEEQVTYLVEPFSTAKGKMPLYPVLIPRDAKNFVVVDDELGFDVMFRCPCYKRAQATIKWLPLSQVWRNTHPCNATVFQPVSIVLFGRKVLRRAGCKKTTLRKFNAMKAEERRKAERKNSKNKTNTNPQKEN